MAPEKTRRCRSRSSLVAFVFGWLLRGIRSGVPDDACNLSCQTATFRLDSLLPFVRHRWMDVGSESCLGDDSAWFLGVHLCCPSSIWSLDLRCFARDHVWIFCTRPIHYRPACRLPGRATSTSSCSQATDRLLCPATGASQPSQGFVSHSCRPRITHASDHDPRRSPTGQTQPGEGGTHRDPSACGENPC